MRLMNWEMLLQRSRSQTHAILLVSNGYLDEYGNFELMYGEGFKQAFTHPVELDAFDGLAFGHVGYHFKNNLYRHLFPQDEKKATWPDFYFFEPLNSYLIHRDGRIESNLEYDNVVEDINPIQQFGPQNWMSSETPESYLEKIKDIQTCIRNGVFYEMNFCQSFQAESEIDPYRLFWELNRTAPNPFAVFYKLEDRYLIGSSPERFLQKRGSQLISQPIKGTVKRNGFNDITEVERLKSSKKDRAENVMIVDLVRNDLSRVCQVGTVVVDELCGIYSYPNVHQMISTVSGELSEDISFKDILEALFPMGSMTGAPKIEVMKHIDRLENFNRELYSGCIGYFYRKDFDFNVVIRSLEYHKGILKYAVGGAITIDSQATEELEECVTKASSIRGLFKETN